MTDALKKMCKSKFNLRSLRLSLKYRPGILKLILKMRHCIRKKNSILNKLKSRLKELESDVSKDNTSAKNSNSSETVDKEVNFVKISPTDTKDINQTANLPFDTSNSENKSKTNSSTQTDTSPNSDNNESVLKPIESEQKPEDFGWKVNEENETKSIAEQVKEAAQDAVKQTGMVYVESAGMYYDYKTGYYYNSELGLYYHTDTECYYIYSEEKQAFIFHSYPDRAAANAQALLLAYEKRKAKKHKMERKAEDDIDNLTKNLSQDGEEVNNEVKKQKRKKRKLKKKKDSSSKENEDDHTAEKTEDANNDITTEPEQTEDKKEKEEETEKSPKKEDLEDGECSDTDSEVSISDDDDVKSNASTSTASDDESIARHHPPCMRVIVRETTLSKLRVGSLFIVTKDGGTVGREGEQHTILLKDNNVSRNHLDIRYDMAKKSYMATDLGSKNGSILNGSRMSESQIISEPMIIIHGSTLQLGETKLLCHIHPGHDTCGHCEPGLVMETEDKETKVAYTRTCSVKKQYELELARLKNIYGAKTMLAIEETPYNDRAQARRETVGSSHHAEKTESTDIDTSIAADNKGFKLLEKMGWSKGEGLGKDSQGETEPVPLISNAGKTGLGAITTNPNPNQMRRLGNRLAPATLRLATRTKMLQPPAKAFQGMFDEDSD